MKIRRDSLLGIVFFGGLALVLWATIGLSRFAAPTAELRVVLFDNARGLDKGNKVKVRGVEFGIVDDVEYVARYEETPIKVTLRLERELTFWEGYDIRIEDSSALGGKELNIDPGMPERDGVRYAKINAGETLRGTAPPSPFASLGEFLAGGKNKANFANILDDFATILRTTREGKGTLGKIINEPVLFDDIASVVHTIRTSIEDDRKRGTIGKLIVEDELYTDVSAVASEARQAFEKLNRGDGALARALTDKRMGDDLSKTLENVRAVTDDVRAGRGTIGLCSRTRARARPCRGSSATSRRRRRPSTTSEGTLGYLLHDAGARTKVDSIPSSIDHAAGQLTRNDSTLGRLFNDDALIADLERIVANFSRTIEDAREAAPVQTLFSTFGGVFR
ncbi:MAG: MlaD family protein [Planctomycetota bacterium]